MKLHQLYKRSIERHIDPVAKVDNRSDEVVQQEIEEYFFTDKVIEHLHTILKQLTSGSPGTTGFWINGYYGSGKSHFLKYVYYCLNIPVRRGGAGAVPGRPHALRGECAGPAGEGGSAPAGA